MKPASALVSAVALAFVVSAPSGSTLFGSARAEPAYPINPGYWEATTTFLGMISNTDRWCIQPKDISKFLVDNKFIEKAIEPTGIFDSKFVEAYGTKQ